MKTLRADGTNKSTYVMMRRRELRLKLLDRLAPQRVCPLCEKIKLKSRQWIILTNEQLRELKHDTREVASNARKARAVCKSCFMTYFQ